MTADKTPSLSFCNQGTTAAGPAKGRGWKDAFGVAMQKWDQSLLERWTSPKGFLTVRVKVSEVM